MTLSPKDLGSPVSMAQSSAHFCHQQYKLYPCRPQTQVPSGTRARSLGPTPWPFYPHEPFGNMCHHQPHPMEAPSTGTKGQERSTSLHLEKARLTALEREIKRKWK